ncbi:MAG: LamG-like jellyroll fold domain-containing protein [Planctomycetia bacterium]|nr:LamG-like jellyroll fold domain-containing protein [Planctomycetia bacterium]
MSSEIFNDCDFLVDRFLAGELTEEESEVLLKWMQEDEANREFFRMNILTDFLLRKRTDELEKIRKMTLGTGSSGFICEKRAYLAARTAARLSESRWVCGAGTFLKKCFWPNKHDWEESVAPVFTLLILLFAVAYVSVYALIVFQSMPKDDPITTMARVNEVINVVWSEGAVAYKAGELIDQSEFQLDEGLVQLEMNNGTTLVVEGPAHLEIKDPMNAVCTLGRISVNVSPAATGYKMLTPYGNVIDYGTEFLASVSPQGTHVDVVNGKVDFHSEDNPIVPLVANQSLKINADHKISMTSVSPNCRYIGRKELEKRIDVEAKKELAVKESIVSKIAGDPDLLARFDFTNISRGKVVNESEVGRTVTRNAVTRSVKRSRGRISRTRAISIYSSRSTVFTEIPTSCESMTLDMVAQIKRLKGEGNLLFASEVTNNGQRKFQVQIQHDGRIQVRLQDNEGNFEYYETSIVVSRRMLGTWMRFTFVLDYEAKRIRVYVDGRLDTERKWLNPQSIRLGDSTIGNALPEKGSLANHALNGSLAGFTLWQRALTEQEINSLTLD